MIISYAQNFEDVMLWRALKQVKNGFYIDVGANDPSVDSVTRLFYEKGWNGINIEPLSKHLTALDRDRVRDINIGAAVGSEMGEIEIWECDVRGWATADRDVVDLHTRQGHAGSYTKVALTTLTAVCERYVQGDIHFLKVDVEGFEQSVLEGMDWRRFRPWIVVVEATRPHSTEEMHARWEHVLLDSSYQFAYADGLNRFYLASEHWSLATCFRYPPNFFDEFVKAPELEANLWAQTIVKQADMTVERSNQRTETAELRAANAELRAGHAEMQANETQMRLQDAEARIALATERISQMELHMDHLKSAQLRSETRIKELLNSSSWRITAPLRAVMSAFRRKPGVTATPPLLPTGSRRPSPGRLSEEGRLKHLPPRERDIFFSLRSALRDSDGERI